jgi:hypothetical protein
MAIIPEGRLRRRSKLMRLNARIFATVKNYFRQFGHAAKAI